MASGQGGPATIAANAATEAAMAANTTAQAAVSQLAESDISKIIQQDVKLSDLPKKGDERGILYNSWRTTAVEKIENSILKLLRHKPNFMQELQEIKGLLKIHSTALADFDDMNIKLLLNNYHRFFCFIL